MSELRWLVEWLVGWAIVYAFGAGVLLGFLYLLGRLELFIRPIG